MKNCAIISVSVPKHMVEWLNKHDEVSASKEFQERIEQLITMWERQHNDTAKLQRAIRSLSCEVCLLHKFIEMKGFTEEWKKNGRSDAQTMCKSCTNGIN